MSARWKNSLGEEVDLDDIDREYALNIYTMVLHRRARAGYTAADLREDPLVQKLRDVILEGREPNERDRFRAIRYNMLNAVRDLPWRARVR